MRWPCCQVPLPWGLSLLLIGGRLNGTIGIFRDHRVLCNKQAQMVFPSLLPFEGGTFGKESRTSGFCLRTRSGELLAKHRVLFMRMGKKIFSQSKLTRSKRICVKHIRGGGGKESRQSSALWRTAQIIQKGELDGGGAQWFKYENQCEESSKTSFRLKQWSKL